jgi:CRP-like cAMP-binding protein
MAVDPALQNAILRFLINYIEQISKRAVCKDFHAVEQRMCAWLLMVQNRRSMVKLPLKHEQIGFSLGVQRPCIGNAALELKKKNVIAYTRGKMTILDREELKRLACDCCSEFTD